MLILLVCGVLRRRVLRDGDGIVAPIIQEGL